MNGLQFGRVALAAAIICAGCGKKHSEDEDATTPVVAVKTATISRGDIEVTVPATGKTDAIRKEKILSPISGIILSLKILEGRPVRRGDVLAVIQPRETRSAIVGAEVLLHTARSDGERQEASRALELARAHQNNIEVRASFAGSVSIRNVAEGELVPENGELMTLVDLSSLVFVADVPLHDMEQVRIGERAVVQFPALSDLPLQATVEAINPHSDALSQSVKARLRFRDIPTGMRPMLKTEMNGIARIVTARHRGVLLVQKTAVLRNDEKNSYSIVIVSGDSLAHIAPVTIAARTDSIVEVEGVGLIEGLNVVVEGNYALADSTKLAPAR